MATKKRTITVKPLEWVEAGDDQFIASTICDEYFWLSDTYGPRLLTNYAAGSNYYQGTLAEKVDFNEAKRIAQADFDEKILSWVTLRAAIAAAGDAS